jgi:8-oxo-dGTP pyrophosphatase MutT (NUDIX family)|tara:strand:- start:1051 stop:1671 length:621 start_codon:yes stop_codon:yes gene_type:complete
MNEQFISRLRLKLQQPLPGHESHRKVMEHRKSTVVIDFQKLNPRKSAVLVHLYVHLGQLHLSYIERPEYDGVHSKQISFPGGKAELQDQSLMHTAVREAKEEVNIDPEKLDILGTLSEIYIPPSNFLVQPYVSFHHQRPNFIPDPREVWEIIEFPIHNLIDQELTKHELLRDGKALIVNGYQLNGKVMWGATAMITKEFIDICRNL